MTRNQIIEKFREYQSTRGDSGNDEATVNSYVAIINKVFDVLGEDFSTWTNFTILAMKNKLRKYTNKKGVEQTYATTTYNKILMGFKVFFGFLILAQKDLGIDFSDLNTQKIFDEYATVKVPDSEKKNMGAAPIDYNKFEDFLNWLLKCGKGKTTVRARVIVLLEMTCGLRRTEVQRLKRSQVSFKDNMLYLEDTKFGKHRNVPVQQFVLDELAKLFTLYPDSEHVICTDEGNMVAESQLNRSVKGLTDRAAKKDIIDDSVSNHGLRRTYAGYLHFVKRVPGKYIQELLGHSNFKTTEENYLKVNYSDVKDEIMKIDMLGKEN